MLLSVIIPCFNVEKYIEKCILSVVNNNLQVEDYEIIVIDDESPDSSVEIVKKMQKRYSQIKLLRQKNKGLGGARNTGIDNASGQFIMFLDADDYLNKSVLKDVLDFAVKFNLDILEYGAIGISEKGTEVYRHSESIEKILSGFEYLVKLDSMNSACNKLYSVSFLNKYNLRFIEHIYMEDVEFNTRAFYFAKKVKAIKIIVSCFLQTSNSITRNKDRVSHLKRIRDIEKVIDLINNFMNKVSCSTAGFNMIIKERIALLTLSLLYSLMNSSMSLEQRKIIMNNLKKKKLYPVKTPVRKKDKNLFRVFVNNEFVYHQLCNINQLIKS
jgi:glycosyltransferase involved in cell wall biosynthesis